MGCGCSILEDGKAVVDHVKSKGKEKHSPKVAHRMNCECGEMFVLKTVIMNCPNYNMTYAVTPCRSDKIENIKKAGLHYA